MTALLELRTPPGPAPEGSSALLLQVRTSCCRFVLQLRLGSLYSAVRRGLGTHLAIASSALSLAFRPVCTLDTCYL